MERLALIAALVGFGSQDPPKVILHESTNPPFSLRLPAGYAQASFYENVVSFVKPKGTAEWEKFYVDLTPLGVALERNVPATDITFLKKFPFADIREKKSFTAPWENLDIDAVEFRFAREGTEMVGRCAWVPIDPTAVAVCVSAPITLQKELMLEFLGILAVFKGRTRWLTEREAATLQHWSAPAYAVPVVSGLFFLSWAILFRGQPMRFHYVRVAWHALVPLTAAFGWFLVQRSADARQKLGMEAPLWLWFLIVLPLTIFHLVMITHRVRMAVEMGD